MGNDNGNNDPARFLDWHSYRWDVLHVAAAGNKGDTLTRQIGFPGDLFNGITVGAVDATFQARASYSSSWLDGDDGTAADRRGKPDILAYGGTAGGPQSSNGYLLAHGTSYAVPLVAGTAALLYDPELPGYLDQEPGGEYGQHLAAKAIILNSARKRYINGPENDFTTSSDGVLAGGNYSDADYLNATGVLRPGASTATSGALGRTSGWTPTEWSTNAAGTVLTVTKPLDDEQGVGILDTERAIIQHQGGRQDGSVAVGPVGWDLNTLSPADRERRYNIEPNMAEGEFVTLTLCWDRVLDEKDGNDTVEAADDYEDRPAGANDLGAHPNFNLQLFRGNTLVAESIAGAAGLNSENVEHLHVPVPVGGDDYNIRVRLEGPAAVTRQYYYSLAWWTPADIGAS